MRRPRLVSEILQLSRRGACSWGLDQTKVLSLTEVEVLEEIGILAGKSDDLEAVPDLRFEAHLLSTGGDLVACRLWFDCTPTSTFLGLEPTGRAVSFAEHVFYRFEGGRIAHVWSLIDRDAVASQFSC